MADDGQIQNLIKVSTTAASSKHSERVESGGEFDQKNTKEGTDATEGNALEMLSLYVAKLRIAILLGNYKCSLSVCLVSVCVLLQNISIKTPFLKPPIQRERQFQLINVLRNSYHKFRDSLYHPTDWQRIFQL